MVNLQIEPYQVIPYKNGMGIKKVIIEKREVA
jgi:hypothetical protein